MSAVSILLVLNGCAEPEHYDSERRDSEVAETADLSTPEPGTAVVPGDTAEPDSSPAPQPETPAIDPDDAVDATDATRGLPDLSIPEDTLARLAANIDKVMLEDVAPVDAEGALAKFDAENLREAFEAVASGIAYEPYSGVLRGAKGTALAGSGNAIDQALLLARVLDGNVNAWRIAEGRLEDEALSTLLATVGKAYDGDHEFVPDDPELYDPANEAHFREVAKVHYWLEVKEAASDAWLALDPSYPKASVGQSFATATRRLDVPDALMMQRLEIRFMQENAGGKVQRVGAISGQIAELALHPIVLVTRGMPQYAASPPEAEADSGESADDLPGAEELPDVGLDEVEETDAEEGNGNAVTARAIFGTEYQRELSYGGNEALALTATMVTDAEPESRIVREWIVFILRTPGAANREIVHDLYHASAEDNTPATLRRHSITLVTGRVNREMLEGYRARLDPDRINDARRKIVEPPPQLTLDELAEATVELESATALVPHLMNLIVAHESDELTERLASRAAVSVIHDAPRILITTLTTDMAADGSAVTRTIVDQRLDEVRAVPYTGMPDVTTRLFQRTRGMQQSALVARVLARFVDEPADIVTTTRIMHDAQSQDKQMLVLSKDNRSALQELSDLPGGAASRINTALDAGYEIIMPSGAASIAGDDRWGWWEVDPATGAFTGFLDGGQHQTTAQYSVMLAESDINDAWGFVIGETVESAATLTSYAARTLQYGPLTQRLTQEVAAVIESLTCETCPDVDVSVVTLPAPTGFDSPCLDRPGAGTGPDDIVAGDTGFCEQYKLPISCAASLMLASFEHEDNAAISHDFSLGFGPLSCD